MSSELVPLDETGRFGAVDSDWKIGWRLAFRSWKWWTSQLLILQIKLAVSTMSGFFTCALDQVLIHLCSCVGGEVNYVCNLKKNLAALEKTMKVLRARRADVLKKVQRQESEGLQRLNEVDVWLTSAENIQNQVYELLRTCTDECERLRLCGLCSKNLRSSHSYGKKVFEMLKEVEDVQSKGVFEVVVGPPTIAVAVERPLPLMIVGQEKMLIRAWEHLMKAGTGMMGLYGMGGVGKTTLLEQINNKFLKPVDGVEIVIFVVVSSELRVEMIQDAIAEKLGFRTEEWNQKQKSQKVTDLYTRMRTKKFVLLLDDIWREVDLKEIGVPYPTRENGCKVVFTSRSREVCGQMGVHDPMEVKCLESDEAWDLFRAKVGKITLESHPDILEFACQVAGECRGLPLPLNIIGKNMASKRTKEEWEQAIDTLSSSAAEFPVMKDHILPILKYSYDSLKGEHVKSCFQYCALFPEDFAIEKEKLVDYWICEGFIDEKQGIKKARNHAYVLIGTLVEACLLTEEGKDKSKVKMHDVVREMALWIASDFGKDKERCIVKAGVRLREAPKVENWRSVRRMSLMDNKIENISESSNCPELTTLLFQKNDIGNISGEFFKSMPKLVVLDLSNNRLFRGFPEEISKLVSLRYLNLSGSRGTQRSFKCLLELKRLIYLNLEGTGLQCISGISNLSSLRTLLLVANNCSFNGMELQFLEHLEVVTIEIGSDLVADQLVNAYKVANAIQELSIRYVKENIILTLPDMAVLSTLDMFDNRMVEINVKRYSSSLNKSPTTPSFPNLSTVRLVFCHWLKDLTWLLLAPNLKSLYVDSSDQVEDIICKEKAANILTEEEACTIIPFRKLEHLKVGSLRELKGIYWSPLSFPRLTKFIIEKCPNLRKLPLDSKSGSSIAGEELVIHIGQRYWIDMVEWEDEATKERFLRSIRYYC